MAYIDEGWERGHFGPSAPTYSKIGSERRFGVELEYNDLPDEALDLQDKTVFGAKEDCSVDGGEFDSPILYGDQGLDAVTEFCGHADRLNFRAGRGAGYHLHLDMTNETHDGLKRIALGYHYTKNLWLGSVPSWRRNFTYSRPHNWGRRDVLAWDDTDTARQFFGRLDRYLWLNMYSYCCHRTFEVRCHESLNDGFAVNAWVIAHTRFSDAMSELGVGKITRTFGNKKPDDLMREVRAVIQCPEVSEHLKKRYNEFNR